jgi:hypothetical protein
LKELKTKELSSSYVVGEGYPPVDKNISNTQTLWQLLEGDEKSIPAIKIYILWDMADSIPYLVPSPTQFQESISLPINHPKILASEVSTYIQH